MRWRRALGRAVGIASLGIGVGGCAALPLAVVAGSLMDAGGGVIVKTGTEYTASGTVRRTFNLPVDQVHSAVLETFTRAQVVVTRDQASPKRQVIVATTQHRKVYVELLPLTPMLTTLELDVKRNVLSSDKATASELLAETEQVVAERAMLAMAPEPSSDTTVSTATAQQRRAPTRRRSRAR